MTTPLRAKVQALAADLDAALLERTEAVRGLVLALLAGVHVLLLGPPGTAKSALARALTSRLVGARGFDYLLTRFSEPGEVFGPPSLAALEAGRQERVVTGKLPEAHVAFLDEIFKANSAILNSLLTILNERKFSNGGPAPTPVPLLACVAASNELPQGEDLSALWDRFLVRFWVSPLAEEGSFRALLTRPAPTVRATLTLAELEAARAEVAAIPLAPAALDALVALRAALAAAGIVASDRRWVTALGLLRASAWLASRAEVQVRDLEPLADVLWPEPEARGKVRSAVLSVAAPSYARALEGLDRALPARDEALRIRATDAAGRAAISAALAKVREVGDEVEALAATSGIEADPRVGEIAKRVRSIQTEIARHLVGTPAKPAVGVRS